MNLISRAVRFTAWALCAFAFSAVAGVIAVAEGLRFQPMPGALYTVHAFEDLAIGRSESLMRTVMERDISLFADLSGDANPIHLCDRYAANTKFGQRIAHGMLTASLVSALSAASPLRSAAPRPPSPRQRSCPIIATRPPTPPSP